MASILARLRAAVLLTSALATTSCGTLGNAPAAGVRPVGKGFQGAIAADEPQAALIARAVLAAGGNAADAATALGFALAVTLPSRAGLGGGGACLVYQPKRSGPGGGVPQAVLFTPEAPTAPAAATLAPGTDRPAALPLMARGLYLLHATYGAGPIAGLIVPAERLARFGVPVSAALANDLEVVAGPLFADPAARAIFAAPSGAPLAAGADLVQPDLAATLADLRVNGVGDLYQGGLSQRFAEAARAAGGGLTVAALRAALPRLAEPIVLAAGYNRVAFLPPPADGGLAAAGAFAALQHDPRALAAAAGRGLAVANAWRHGGGTPSALLHATLPPAALRPLPASTSFAVIDRHGMAVGCALTMDNLFGTGRVAQGTGMVLAASPAAVPPPLLSAALAWNPNIPGFRAVVTGSGQQGAPMAVALGMADALKGRLPMPQPVPDPGRANAIACAGFLPRNPGSCGWATDPRGAGLAIGAN